MNETKRFFANALYQIEPTEGIPLQPVVVLASDYDKLDETWRLKFGELLSQARRLRWALKEIWDNDAIIAGMGIHTLLGETVELE